MGDWLEISYKKDRVFFFWNKDNKGLPPRRRKIGSEEKKFRESFKKVITNDIPIKNIN